jgi:hypothetical protein
MTALDRLDAIGRRAGPWLAMVQKQAVARSDAGASDEEVLLWFAEQLAPPNRPPELRALGAFEGSYIPAVRAAFRATLTARRLRAEEKAAKADGVRASQSDGGKAGQAAARPTRAAQTARKHEEIRAAFFSDAVKALPPMGEKYDYLKRTYGWSENTIRRALKEKSGRQ